MAVRRPGETKLRNRYVSKAKRLMSQTPAFRESMAEARRRWDDAFPDFRIGRPAPAPDDQERVSVSCFDRLVLPRRLRDALERQPPEIQADDEFTTATLIAAMRTHGTTALDTSTLPPELDLSSPGGASIHWRLHVAELTDRWFPPRYFPRHPTWKATPLAAPYLSRCLVFDERDVDPEAILLDTIIPESIPFDPHRVEFTHRGAAIAIHNRASWVQAVCEELALEPERLARVAQRACDLTRAAEVSGAVPSEQADQEFWFVPLTPTLTQTAWNAIGLDVVRKVNEIWGNDQLPDWITELRNEGKTDSEIALLLGVSDELVRTSS